MMTSDPERIVAVWLRSGTAFATWEKGEVKKPEISEATYRIPVICNPGVKERDEARFKGAWDGALAMFRAYRAKGAPIGVAPDPRTGHECGDSRYLAIPYFDACLAARLPDKGADGTTLKAVELSSGWRAQVLSDTAEPASAYHGEAAESVWLPDEHTASAWMEYVKTGAVSDTTPPKAPTGLMAMAAAGRGRELTWDAEADLESGLRQFIVQRDGKEIGRVPREPIGKFGRPLFQSMSYHDTPERPLPALRFVDDSTEPGSTPEYRVVAVNGVGLESEPSAVTKAP
jgi:hypothetical protein